MLLPMERIGRAAAVTVSSAVTAVIPVPERVTVLVIDEAADRGQ